LKILSVHNRYLHHGGEEESSRLENALLRSHGHHVEEYVLDNHDIQNQLLFGVGLRSIWNQKSYAHIRQHIRQHRIELVRSDNFFPQISPAVFYAARAEGVPTVQTLRNFRLSCPSAVFFRDGNVCEDCLGKLVPWPGILHGCYRNSNTQTLAPAFMATLHRIAGTWNHRVSAYIALSEFSRAKFVQIGLPKDKIFVKPNFVTDSGVGAGDGSYALFVGRLSPEKGIDVLLEAWKTIQSDLKLVIAGSGPLAQIVRQSAAVNPAVTYLGQTSLEQTYELMGQASVLMFPSKWYETFGRTVAEAFAKGTPVIASNIGTMKTMITHQQTGLHFDAGKPESMVEQLRWMLADRDRWQRMRSAARQTYEKHYTPERNYEMMMQIYTWALTHNQTAPEGCLAANEGN
jgi:glycosyltransferase involved in cell wall biosynthesis